MPESLLIASPSAGAEPALIPRNTARVVISILLTVLDSWAVVAFGGTLYHVSAHHPIWLIGIVLLFVSLCASLARAWYLALTVSLRYPQPIQLNLEDRRFSITRRRVATVPGE